ncbi:MAG: transporter substrate-binding domain-containing protein, partial [Elainellaceae cyanobacterium]
ADLIAFRGPNDRADAVQALTLGEIDAFVGDDVLSYAELVREGRDVDNFALVPEIPLFCEFYGFVLPNDDPAWKDSVNAFLASDAENTVFGDWFSTVYPLALEVTDYCLNQR